MANRPPYGEEKIATLLKSNRSRRLAQAVFESLEPRQLLSAGTLRIAAYNINGDTTDFTNQSAPLETVLEAIGADPLNDNGTTNAQPLDVLGLEELGNNNTNGSPGAPTLQSIVANLNATYGAGTYNFDATTDPTDGNDTGNGPSGLVYNTKTVEVLSAAPIGTVSGSGVPRAPMMYELQPIGYPSSADFYVIVSHTKSGTGTSNANRRNEEAQEINAAVNALPANSHVIAMGDFNIDGGSGESTYQTLRTDFDDPANPAGNWQSSSAFMPLQSESATDLEFRDDIQFVTPAADAGSTSPGVQLDSGSLNIFGNGGNSALFEKAVTSASNTGVFPTFTSTYRAQVLTALTQDTDHLPVLADYTIQGIAPNGSPTIGSFSVTPGKVVTGSDFTLSAGNVTDTGPAISRVAFYRESNGTSGLQTGSDTFLGDGVQNGSTWSLSTAATGLSAGSYTYYAVATDTSNFNSPVSSTTLTVAAIPPYVSFSSGAVYTWDDSTGNLTLTSGTITFTGDQATSGDTIDPLINLTATGPAASAVFNTTEHLAGLTLAGGANASVVFGAHAIINTSSLTINPGSTFDLTTNTLAVNFGSPANDPTAGIVADLSAGYNGGAWTGQGLTSSSAAGSTGEFTIGYANGNTDLDTPAAPNQLLVAYTLPGNANLDNSVGFADLVAVAENFGATGRDWSQGNFTYDPAGSVGFADLVLVAENFGRTTNAAETAVAPTPAIAPLAGQAAKPTANNPTTPAASNPPADTDDSLDSLLGARPRRRRHWLL